MRSKKWLSILMVLLGNVIYALTVKLFLVPANLISCGTNGIALVMEHLLDIPMTTFIFCFNLVMLGVGWLVLGRKFAMTTILSSILYPLLLELLIQDSLEKMKNIGTMLIVAHRLSTIQHSDKIILLSHGEIIEQGDHQELLRLHGRYYQLYMLQFSKQKLLSGE